VAAMMSRRFQVAARRFGLDKARDKLDLGQFRVPGRAEQLTLF
jgi:hypothetical protein